ncbi:PepSY-associated TM helix domain-containing protein [Stakelama tenebrarum]|uniref:PepSY domain-containing protein n=1 Tax=Stakelama tenebrarum TaxID=2711215 RepID=A0A6G6Y222_9SPHN|nr:PepSY-associated TM helix domain-containing protein [Sphingosinithalassobacter tenebrarum]QIG78994.1 PepSY domain-containing protein [Sphingosinithalassobacter tenebrarum]
MNVSRLIAQSLRAHSLLGLVLGALMYQVCLTGTVSMVAPEWKRWEQPAAPRVAAGDARAFAAALAAGVEQAGDPNATVMVFGPTDDLPRMRVRVPGVLDSWTDPEGTPVAPAVTPWTTFLVSLHDSLHLPFPWGRLLIAISGVALLGAIGTGVLAHRRIFKDAFRLRLGGSRRLEAADLHNRMSVWALPFHTAIALTGAALALVAIAWPLLGSLEKDAGELYGPPAAAAPQVAETPPDIAAMIDDVERRTAPAKVNFLLVQRAGSPDPVIEIGTDAPRDLANGEAWYPTGDGSDFVKSGFTDGSAGKQIQAALYPLHVGKFGGLPMRLLYVLLGLALCWITATGMTIWFERRRSKGRHSAILERLWCAILWGQPLALATSALIAAMGLISPAEAYAGITLLTLLVAAPPLKLPRLSMGLRLLTLTAIAAACAIQLAAFGWTAADPLARWMNVSLLAASLIICAGLVWQRIRSKSVSPA